MKTKGSHEHLEWVTEDFGHCYQGRRLDRGRTAFQVVELFRHETFGTLLFLDGKIQISSRDEDRYHQYLVAAPLLAHRAPRSLCIIGGGDCFGLEEAVKHPGLRRIRMFELDAGVVDFCRRHYPAVRRVLRDPRLELVYTDARARLAADPDTYDVIVLDLTEPSGPSTLLYTREFYRLCRRRLKPGGILSVHTDNPFLFPEAYATIYKTLRAVFPHLLTARVDMPSFGMGWTYRLAAVEPLDYGRLVRRTKRFLARGGSLDQFTPTTYLLEPTPRESRILATQGRISTDRRPFDKFAETHDKVRR